MSDHPSPDQQDSPDRRDRPGRPRDAGFTDEQLDFLNSTFDLARSGDASLLQLVDAGVPVNLTDAKHDTLLILATYYGHDDLVAGLLARGADTERVNQRGQTALISAVFRQSEPNVRALLAAGADPNTGSPDAYATADFFDLPAMRALLGGRRV